MPPLPLPAVQLITGPWRDLEDLRARVAAALGGGIRWVQLRAKDRCAGELHEAALLLAPMMEEVGGLFVVNDRVDVALASGAGGVHLPENGMTPREARRLLGDDAWIGRSVHSVEAIASCAMSLLDAVQFGPVFDTASKRGFGQPQGLEELALAAAVSRRLGGPPIVAVGGVSSIRSRSCLQAGAAAVAMIGFVWDAPDVKAAAQAAVASVTTLV